MCILYQRSLFIHVPKTAGSSIAKIFNRTPGTLRLGMYTQSFNPHVAARSIRNSLTPIVWDSLWSWAVVRNPWDWFVSYYCYVTTKSIKHPLYKDVEGMSFQNYVEHIVEIGYPRQYDFIADADNNILVNYVGRFEELELTWETIRSNINMDIPDKLPHLNATKHGDYRAYHNKATIKIIGDIEQPLIERFNYKFSL